MSELHRHRITDVFLEDEMRTSYLNYSMSVIVSRALPDIRDGLKPSQRRILVAMNDLGLAPGRPYRKCAKIAGDTSGNYHPHGEQVVYPTLVRMAQEFNMRYPLVDGQGNFGCFTGDTKIRLLDGTDKSFQELSRLGPEGRFHVYSVDRDGRIVVGEGRNARITKRGASLVQVTLDDGSMIRCTPDHRFLLRDNTYKEAQDLTADDHLFAGYFDSAPVKAGMNDYLRVLQPKTGEYEFVHRIADGREALTPALYEAERSQNWVPRLDVALRYFEGFEDLADAANHYNHRIVSVQHLVATADVYDITVDEHHNFLLADGVFVHNSIDGDAPAAMRYTEARLTPIAMEMIRDLEKNTVEMRPNYDETLTEPVILPSVVPSLLLNGASGIAVGMATEIPPHNLTEICDALVLLLDKPEATLDEIMQHVKGPDFPTGGTIYGFKGIRDCYEKGRGLMRVRAKVGSEEGRAGRMSLVVTEIPFQVNKTNLLEKIADLVKDQKLTGISDLRDESDRDGMRIVIELKKDAQPKIVLNQLYVHTQLQSTFGAIMLSLVDGRPQTLPLKGMLEQYVEHRKIVVRRRTEFELAEAEKRAHILEGLKIALDHLDEVIALIRKSNDTEAARAGLMTTFGLSELQANAILDMRLGRLVALERDKIEKEYLEVIKLIEELRGILANPRKILAIIKSEVLELKKKYGDERRTDIVPEEGEISLEDLIKDEDMVVTISHAGYIKRNPVSLFRAQRRGGKGLIGAKTKEEDFVEHLFVASTHAYLLFLTNRGRCYWLKVHEIDQAGRAAKGRPIINLVEMNREERVTTVVPVKVFDDQHYLVMATRMGTIKKTLLSAYGNPRRGGINAIDLDEGDEMIEAAITDGTQDLILAKSQGKAIRFHEQEVRAMGRTAHGVKAVTLEAGDVVVSMVPVRRDATLLSITENGYGKCSRIEDYRVSHRGGIGIITIKTTDRNGSVVAVKEVIDADQLMIMTSGGQLIRMPVKGISVIGRNTQGVRLINLDEGDKVSDVARVVIEDEEPVGEEDLDASLSAEDEAGDDDNA